MRAPRGEGWRAGACAAAAALAASAAAWAAESDVAKLVEAAKQEGEVHYIDSTNQARTHAAVDRAFRRKYSLPDSFKFTHTLQGTGQVVATVQQEIKAGQHTIDVVWVGAPGFYKAAAKEGHLLPYVSPEWRHYERTMKRVGMEADPPAWVTPVAYAFVPVWNRKCPGFANLQITSWKDLLNPVFKGKMIIADVRRSFTYAATWVGVEGAMGKDYFPKFVELTQPIIIFRTEEAIAKVISCEYPIQIWQRSGYVYQRTKDDPALDLGLAWPREGIVLVGGPLAILKGARHPNAAKLLVDFFLSEEGMREIVAGEAIFSLRDGFRVPDPVRRYAPELDAVKSLPVNWAGLTLPEVKKVQDEFRKILRVD